MKRSFKIWNFQILVTIIADPFFILLYDFSIPHDQIKNISIFVPF